MKKIFCLILAIILLAFALAGCREEDDAVIKLGVVGEANEAWQPVIENLKSEGITLEIVAFSDYTLPNRALADGEIDLNSFQHYAYLENDIETNGYDLTVIGETVIAPLGVYSNKITDLSELSEGDSIAVPSDMTN